MRDYIIRAAACLLLTVVAGQAAAQTDYDPANPPDPLQKTKVTCATSPANAGYTSGAGSYVSGTTVTVSTSAKTTAYDFLYWTLGGERYTDSRTFTYTTGREQVDFVAVYDYNPKSPGDPQTDHHYHLNLAASPAGACSFNLTSGARHLAGDSVTVRAYPNQYYSLQGWYLDGVKVGDGTTCTVAMPEQSVTLTAVFAYDFQPADPADPASTQTDVDNTLRGDVNGDGRIDVSDASAIATYVTGTTISGFIAKAADYNGDGRVDVSDASAVASHVVGQ